MNFRSNTCRCGCRCRPQVFAPPCRLVQDRCFYPADLFLADLTRPFFRPISKSSSEYDDFSFGCFLRYQFSCVIQGDIWIHFVHLIQMEVVKKCAKWQEKNSLAEPQCNDFAWDFLGLKGLPRFSSNSWFCSRPAQYHAARSWRQESLTRKSPDGWEWWWVGGGGSKTIGRVTPFFQFALCVRQSFYLYDAKWWTGFYKTSFSSFSPMFSKFPANIETSGR